MLRKLFIVILLFINTVAGAQSVEVLKFETQTYDFGTIDETAGAVTYEFRFRNTGKTPITITNVHASCGCTTPGWTKEAIAPGEEGFIIAQYDPYNRPGAFHKSLTIYTDLKGETTKLFIKGNVTPKPKSPEEELLVAMGDLRLKYSTLNMGKVFTEGEAVKRTFQLYNAGEQNLIFLRSEHPEHVMVSYPDTLKPGQVGDLEISYDAIKKGEPGFFSENVTLYSNEPFDSIKSLTLFTNILEYFPPMTKEELAKAPRLSFGEQVFDFNEAKEGEIIQTRFEFKNNGSSVLSIRKVEPNCTCVTAEPEKKELAPGESAIILVNFDTEDRRGNQQKAITVYSNDPVAPVQRLTVKGKVE